MIEKIRYRLVYNRKNTLNNQGTALVQIEALLHKRKLYISTNVYLRPEEWDKDRAQVVNHPQGDALNAMLYEKILELQAGENGRKRERSRIWVDCIKLTGNIPDD